MPGWSGAPKMLPDPLRPAAADAAAAALLLSRAPPPWYGGGAYSLDCAYPGASGAAKWVCFVGTSDPPNEMDECPPGGASTRDDALSVM